MGERAADLSSADERDLIASHGETILGKTGGPERRGGACLTQNPSVIKQ
jgi:hypothetical protein